MSPMNGTNEILRTATFGTTEIQYSDCGQGEPLLLVHAGVFADWFVPLAASDTLSGFRVLRVRRAGYGKTPPSVPVSIADHAQHLADLLRLLEIAKAHVVGHSSGALIALHLAADKPHMVQSLSLIEPAPLGPFQVPAFEELGAQFIAPAVGAYSAGDLPGAVHKFMTGTCGTMYRAVLDRSLDPNRNGDLLREADFFFRDEIPACMQWQFDDVNAACVTSPVLVVEGREGRRTGLLSAQVTDAATRLFPRAETALLDSTNHMLPLQDPHGLGRIVADFARRHAIGKTRADLA